jgi:hypothetical protein
MLVLALLGSSLTVGAQQAGAETVESGWVETVTEEADATVAPVEAGLEHGSVIGATGIEQLRAGSVAIDASPLGITPDSSVLPQPAWTNQRWVVTLGDSAISGEGGRWAGNTRGDHRRIDALGDGAYQDAPRPTMITMEFFDDGRQRPATGRACLRPKDGNAIRNQVVVLGPCDHEWVYFTDGSIRHADSGRCLAPTQYGAGESLRLTSCVVASSEQQWIRHRDRLIQASSGLCIYANTRSTVQTAHCGTVGFQFKLSPNALSEQVPNCHRSRSAPAYVERPSALAVGNRKPTGNFWGLNLACSGARTRTYWDSGDHKPGVDLGGQAGELQEFAEEHRVGAVSLLTGANDLGYSEILKTCAERYVTTGSGSVPVANYCHDDNEMSSLISLSAQRNLESDIQRAVDNVYTAMDRAGYDEDDWALFVNTYWQVLPDPSDMRYGEDRGTFLPMEKTRANKGGCPFFDRDIRWGREVVVPALNGAIREVVQDSPHDNIYLIDNEYITSANLLCARGVGHVGSAGWRDAGAVDNSEWTTMARIINQQGITQPPVEATHEYQMQEGGHINYWGQLAMRNCLRQALNRGRWRSVNCGPADGLNDWGEPNVDIDTKWIVPRLTCEAPSMTSPVIECKIGGVHLADDLQWFRSGTHHPDSDGQTTFRISNCRPNWTYDVEVRVLAEGQWHSVKATARCPASSR